MQIEKDILCFGDSLTWGWIPIKEGAPTKRYPLRQRWPGVMASQLGEHVHIIEEGLNGRTTSANDPNDPRLNGSHYLPSAIASHLPLDLVIIMLGTNDTKCFFNRTPFDITYGMSKLVGLVLSSSGGVGTAYPAPKCLVVAPPPLNSIQLPFFQGTFDGAREKSCELAQRYKDMADFMNIDFLDAGDFVTTEGCDGIHFTSQNNISLGKAIAVKVNEIFLPKQLADIR